jgi:hypothetical protein
LRETAPDQIHLAGSWVKANRARGLGALDEIFRSGLPPARPLSGRYAGELVALDVTPGLTQLGQWIAGFWLPWRGKTFDPAQETGDNLFTRDSLWMARILWPFYHHYLPGGPDTYRAFPFHTYTAPGLTDPDRQVLKIDYNLKLNPGLTVRRVLDELVQVADGFYLGKAHMRWWWGRWQLVAYFTLAPMDETIQTAN